MRLFIKVGGRDKLIRKAEDGGGFQMVEVMVTRNFELEVPDPEERKYWAELYPSWEEKALHVDGYQAGCLMGLITQANEKARRLLDSVWEELVAMKKQAEEEAGVKKEMLPGGMIRIRDKDGNVIIRQPYPYEVEGN